jgi:hypothetical protein
MTDEVTSFECRLYIPAHGLMAAKLRGQSSPRRLVKLLPLSYDELADPSFRRLLAAFETVGQPYRV